MPFTLQDSGGNLWQFAADSSGRMVSTSLGAGTAPALFLNDILTSSSWQLGVTTSGQITSTAVAAGAFPVQIALSLGYFLRINSSGIFVTLLVAVASGPQPYSYTTLGTARQELANRLYDPTQTFWSAAELNAYLAEALRTWNALTSYWRAEFLLTPQQGVTWYDLAQVPNSIRPYTVTDASLYLPMQYHLLEPATGINPWAGSAQFAADDFLNAVSRRRDELLSTAGCTISRRVVPAVAGRTVLPDTVIDIRRVAYLPAVGSPSTLWPEDTWGEMAFQPRYLQLPAGTPDTYLQTTQPPISFDTNRPPGSAGSYELLTVEAGIPLSAATPSTLNIPDDWTPTIKWGALADLLSRESNAKDSVRAQYCEARYRMGLRLLGGASALLALRIGNVPVQIDSIRAADNYAATWQGQTPGPPTAAYYAGLNLVALAPAPDAGAYSATATVIENTPIPTSDASLMQMGRDDYDAMLDYAQHLAAFKMGGSEFLATMPLFQRFMKQASVYSSKLAEVAEYTSAILGLASREKDMNPITTPTEDASA